MTYEQAKKLEEKHRAQGRRNMVTAYVFLLLSAIVFGIFYLKVHELTLAGCGFLCDAAALLYLLRAAPAVIPFRQASLAAKCAASPSEETVYALCASLESAGEKVKYGKGPRERFEEAWAACQKRPELPEDARKRLRDCLYQYGKVQPQQK